MDLTNRMHRAFKFDATATDISSSRVTSRLRNVGGAIAQLGQLSGGLSRLGPIRVLRRILAPALSRSRSWMSLLGVRAPLVLASHSPRVLVNGSMSLLDLFGLLGSVQPHVTGW
jgi:hypothetical protein